MLDSRLLASAVLTTTTTLQQALSLAKLIHKEDAAGSEHPGLTSLHCHHGWWQRLPTLPLTHPSMEAWQAHVTQPEAHHTEPGHAAFSRPPNALAPKCLPTCKARQGDSHETKPTTKSCGMGLNTAAMRCGTV